LLCWPHELRHDDRSHVSLLEMAGTITLSDAFNASTTLSCGTNHIIFCLVGDRNHARQLTHA
jgi:hypothetical protein